LAQSRERVPGLLPRTLTLLAVATLVAQPAAFGQGLPDFGSPADSVLTKSREKLLGDSVVFQLRRAGAIVDDALLNEYIRILGSQLASQVNDGDYAFQFFMIDDSSINAFAMPGGVIGVHTGLLLATDNESELAGVIAHEVSHVTQRHIARALYDQQRGSILAMATAIASILIAATTDVPTETASAVSTATQAAAIQRQITFTRAHEYEADRIGMDVLSRAGFDPTAMASFFEQLGRLDGSTASNFPEMLRTHPTSSGRVAEARGRARQLPRTSHVDSIAYGLAKARIRVLSAARPGEALGYYQQRAGSRDPGDRYGLALSLAGVGRDDEAERLFAELISEHPNVIAFRIGRAEALMAGRIDEQAMAVYREANAVSPRNTPLVISYAEALLESDRPAEAHALLLDLLNNVPPTPEQIQLIARAAAMEGDRINSLHYLSEYFASIGDLRSAIAQLQQALATEGINSVQRARFDARIAQFQEYIAESERTR
jgi:predicted Zn-dependent protease